MGVRRLTICLKNTLKDTIFLKKCQKTYYFGRPRGGGGARAPYCPPLRTPMWRRVYKIITWNQSYQNLYAYFIILAIAYQESFFRRFKLSTMRIGKRVKAKFGRMITFSQFHHHFKSSLFSNFLFSKKYEHKI